MISKLRWKFIRITMLSVFAVLLLIVVAVNAFNISQNNHSADFVTKMLLDNNGSFQKDPPGGGKPVLPKPGGKWDDRFHNRDELPFSTRFFTVTLNSEGEIVSTDLNSIASVTQQDVADFTSAILAKNRTTGWYQTYRYRVSTTEQGIYLIVVEATATRNAIYSVLAITAGVALAAFAGIFLLVALLSRRAIRPISEAYEKQKQFITDAGHELKTPLTVIAADAEILSLTYGENEWCGGIRRQAETLRVLIAQMIQLSKLDEGRQTLTFRKFNVSDAVYDTALSFRAMALARNLPLETEIAPDQVFSGDEAAIRQVVSILVDNAVKYCDDRGRIRVSLHPAGKKFGREKISICVQNTCRAASSLDTRKVFDRFYRADPAHTANHSFGLGLPIAKSIVELHGGVIDVQQPCQQEIAFTVTLSAGNRADIGESDLI